MPDVPEVPAALLAEHDRLWAAAEEELNQAVDHVRELVGECGPMYGAAVLANQIDDLDSSTRDGLLVVALTRLAIREMGP